ncbi:MAG TPA: HEAT repeat domain-containing protein [Candidatus Sulfotelmatobacter sp.]
MLWWTLRKLRSKEPRNRREAVAELAKSEDPAAIDSVLSVLYDPDGQVRRCAIDALAKSQESRALGALGQILASDAETVDIRQYSATALGRNRSNAAIEILSTALDDRSWDMRKRVVEILEKSGWKPSTSAHRALAEVIHFEYDSAAAEGQVAFEPLTKQLEQHIGVNRGPLIDALSRIGGERTAEYFISILTDPLRANTIFRGNEEMRQVMRALSNIGGQRAADYLVSVCSNPALSKLIANDVKTYLGHPRFECAVQGLCAALSNEMLSPSFRCHVAEALGKIGDARAVGPLKNFFSKLRTDTPSVGIGQNDAARGGLFLAKPAQALIDLRQSDDPYVIDYVIQLLRVPGRAKPSNRTPEELTVGVGLAARVLDQRVTDVLAQWLASCEDEHLVPSAGRALKARGWATSLDRSVAVAVAADSWADIEHLGANATQPLLQLLHHPGGLIRYNACVALGKYGDQSALGALESMLEDKEDDVQSAARTALSKLGWVSGSRHIDYRIVTGNEPLRRAANQKAHEHRASDEEILSSFLAEGGAAFIIEFDSPIRTLFYQKDYHLTGLIACCCASQFAFDLPIRWQGPNSDQAMLGYPKSIGCPGCHERVVVCLAGNDSVADIGTRAILVSAYYDGHSALVGEPPSVGTLAISLTTLSKGD